MLHHFEMSFDKTWLSYKPCTATLSLFQVCLYFYNKLYRGNRVTKVDAGGFKAFSSPNLEPLAATEVDISSEPQIKHISVWRKSFTFGV